jgi:hypothetical protein
MAKLGKAIDLLAENTVCVGSESPSSLNSGKLVVVEGGPRAGLVADKLIEAVVS